MLCVVKKRVVDEVGPHVDAQAVSEQETLPFGSISDRLPTDQRSIYRAWLHGRKFLAWHPDKDSESSIYSTNLWSSKGDGEFGTTCEPCRRPGWADRSADGARRAGDSAKSSERDPTCRCSWDSIIPRLSCVEIFQIDEIAWTTGGALHRPQMLERAYRDRHARHLHIDRPRAKLRVWQDALEALNHIQIPEPCSDQRSLIATQQRRDGMLRAKQRFPRLDVTSKLGYNVAAEKLIEERGAQRARRAASRNSKSLRASKIASSRFTASDRCPSARSRSLRTRSPSRSSTCCVDRSAITSKQYRATRPQTSLPACGLWETCRLRIWADGDRGTKLELVPCVEAH